jgi:hypothetical protein
VAASAISALISRRKRDGIKPISPAVLALSARILGRARVLEICTYLSYFA